MSMFLFVTSVQAKNDSDRPEDWKYAIYMTNWGICLVSAAVLLETVIVVFSLKDKPVARISWILTTMTHSMAVFITAMFWSMLYDWSEPPSYSNLFVHGLQAKH